MLENFLWKSSVIVKLQVHTNSSLKNQVVRRNFEAFILGIYFAENLWVAASNVSSIYFSFLFEFCK